MALNPDSYGTVAGVAAYVRRLTTGGAFTDATRPSFAEIESFLDQRSAILNSWIAEAGYSVPVTNATAVLVLSNYANLGAAGLAELTQAAAGYGQEGEDTRENRFLAEFAKAEAWIKGGALAALGVGQVTLGSGLAGLSVGGKRPIFRRSMFGNDTQAEPGSSSDT